MYFRFEENSGGFLIKIGYKIQKTITIIDNVTDNRLINILDLIEKNEQISTVKIANQLNVTKRTILRDIEKLKQQNKLIRIGSEKTGYWKINNMRK